MPRVAPHDGKDAVGFIAGTLHLGRLGELLERALDEGEGRAQFVAHLGVEVKLLALHLAALVVQPRPLPVVHVNGYEQREQQGHCHQREPGEGALIAQFAHVSAGLGVQLLDVFCLPYHLVAFEHEHARIVVGHQGRHEFCLFLVGLAFEDVHCKLQQLVAMGGVDVGRLEQRVAHQPDAAVLARQAVDAAKQGQCLAHLAKCFAGAHCRAVVHAEDQIHLRIVVGVEPLFHDGVGRGLGPVALQGRHHLYAWILRDDACEAVVALNGWRRAFQSHHLHDFSVSVESGDDVFTHQAPHFIVVGAHVGGIFLGTGLSIKHNHRDALVIGSVDGRRDGGHLVGRDNQQVDAALQQAVDLLDLALVAVVGRRKAQLDVVVKIGANVQF